jgi:GNAT superfamily N-acetyltransferase
MTIDGTMLAAYDQQIRTVLPSPPAGVRYEQDGPLLRIVGMYRGFISAPRDVGVRGTELDWLIAKQRDYFAARSEAVGWRTRAHDEPADLPSRLQAAGFVRGEQSTVLIGLTAEIADSPVVPEGVALRTVTADADLRRIAEMESAVWGKELPGLADDLAGRIAAAPDDIAVLAAEADGDVVSAAWLVFRPGTDFASLWGGTTLPRWRGRGIYRALVAARAQRAAERGTRYLQADASDDSAPILRRLGFHAVTTTTPYVWTPPQPGFDATECPFGSSSRQ